MTSSMALLRTDVFAKPQWVSFWLKTSQNKISADSPVSAQQPQPLLGLANIKCLVTSHQAGSSAAGTGTQLWICIVE